MLRDFHDWSISSVKFIQADHIEIELKNNIELAEHGRGSVAVISLGDVIDADLQNLSVQNVVFSLEIHKSSEIPIEKLEEIYDNYASLRGIYYILEIESSVGLYGVIVCSTEPKIISR